MIPRGQKRNRATVDFIKPNPRTDSKESVHSLGIGCVIEEHHLSQSLAQQQGSTGHKYEPGPAYDVGCLRVPAQPVHWTLFVATLGYYETAERLVDEELCYGAGHVRSPVGLSDVHSAATGQNSSYRFTTTTSVRDKLEECIHLLQIFLHMNFKYPASLHILNQILRTN